MKGLLCSENIIFGKGTLYLVDENLIMCMGALKRVAFAAVS
jgi:hypothetical protein